MFISATDKFLIKISLLGLPEAKSESTTKGCQLKINPAALAGAATVKQKIAIIIFNPIVFFHIVQWGPSSGAAGFQVAGSNIPEFLRQLYLLSI